MSLQIADRIFSASARKALSVHRVPDSVLKRLSVCLRTVEKAAVESGMGEFVAARLRPLKAARFALLATPLPGRDQYLRIDAVAANARQDLNYLSQTAGDPRIPEAFAAAIAILSEQANLPENPLGAEFLRLCRATLKTDTRVGILIKEPRYEAYVDSWVRNQPEFQSIRDFSVLSPAALRGSEFFDVIFAFGSPRWYSKEGMSFVFEAPRAQSVHLIGFDWTGLAIERNPVFARPEARAAIQPTPDSPPPPPMGDRPLEDDLVSGIEPRQTVDIERFLRGSRALYGGSGRPEDDKIAKLAILTAGMAVLLECDEDAASYCIDTSASVEGGDDDENGIVYRRQNRDLEEGDFIILRTAGGGDLVPIVADTILGPRAEEFRRRQDEWKNRLDQLIENDGYEAVGARLRRLGATHAVTPNLRAWKRERFIRPNSDEDFRAILQLCGLGSESDPYLLAAKVIMGAHRSAGFEIRRKLIEKVMHAGRHRLRLEGKQEFHLDDIDGGASMTAFRIERIEEKELLVPAHATGYPFKVEEDLWQ